LTHTLKPDIAVPVLETRTGDNNGATLRGSRQHHRAILVACPGVIAYPNFGASDRLARCMIDYLEVNRFRVGTHVVDDGGDETDESDRENQAVLPSDPRKWSRGDWLNRHQFGCFAHELNFLPGLRSFVGLHTTKSLPRGAAASA
jgi:hypothetical protein